VPTIFTCNGKVIYPSFEVIKVICNSFDDFSSITPDYGLTVYLASTFDYYDCGIMLNFAFMSEWLLRIIVLVSG
jgi:hypothetical protein